MPRPKSFWPTWQLQVSAGQPHHMALTAQRLHPIRAVEVFAFIYTVDLRQSSDKHG
jgi:hypothetical protein